MQPPQILGSRPTHLGISILGAGAAGFGSLVNVGGQIAQGYFQKSVAKTEARAARDIALSQHAMGTAVGVAEQRRLESTGVEWAKQAAKVALAVGVGGGVLIGTRALVSILVNRKRS